MAVTVAENSIVKLWRNNEGSLQFAVKSKAPVEQLLAVCTLTVHRLNTELDPLVVLLEPAPTPQGIAIFIDSCDDKATLLTIVRGFAHDLEAAAVEAKIGVFRSQYSPLDDPFVQVAGFSAGLTLIGEPYWGDEASPRGMRRVWDVDPAAEQRVIDHAIGWCNVDGGELWLRADMSIYKVPKGQVRDLLMRALPGRSDWTVLIAADGTDRVRRVCFSRNGHVIYEVGGVREPSWRTSVDELRSVLTDLHTSLAWGFVEARLRGSTSGIGVYLWNDLQRNLWYPHEDTMGHRSPGDTRREVEVVPNVFGLQLLGPGHLNEPNDDRWVVSDLGSGRRLVSHTDPAAWFSRLPELELLLSARRDFGALVDTTSDPPHSATQRNQ